MLATFTTTRKELNATLSRLSATVPARSPKEILQNVKLAINGAVEFSGTDMEGQATEIVRAVDCQHVADKVLALANLMELKRAIGTGGGSVTLHVTPKGCLKIDGLQLAEQPATDEFPYVNHCDSELSTGAAYVRAERLRELLTRTVFCCDVESSRYALGGVKLELQQLGDDNAAGTFLRAIGTDGRRLSIDHIGDEPAELDGGIIPQRAAVVVSRMASVADTVLVESITLPIDEPVATGGAGDSSEVESDAQEESDAQASAWRWPNLATYFRFEFLDASGLTVGRYSTRCVDGRFPDWRQVIPAELAPVATVDASELLAVAKRAMLTTDDDESRFTRCVTMGARPGALLIVNRNKCTGQKFGKRAENHSTGCYRHFQACVNCSFIVDVAKHAGESRVVVSTSNPECASTAPVVFTMDTWRHIVMPLARDRRAKRNASA